MALDLIGQARGVLTLAGEQCPQDYDEDQLAFLRDERDYLNPTLVELPRGDFAVNRAAQRHGRHLAEAAVGAAARFQRRRTGRHRRQGAEGGALPPAACRRLGGAPGRRHRRIAPPLRGRAGAAVAVHAPSCSRTTRSMPPPRPAASARPGRELREPWLAEMREILGEAGLRMPTDTAFRSSGKRGVHSEHMGYILSRDAVPAARLPRGRVVNATLEATRTERAWAVLDAVPDPEVPAHLGARTGHRARGAGPRRVDGDRAHAHLQRLPGHRGHRTQRDRRHRRRRPGPGARDDAPRPGLDHRLDQRGRQAQAARLRHRAARAGGRWQRRRSASSAGAPRPWPARAAAARTPSGCRPSAPPPARRCTAASPAENPSNISNRYEHSAVPRPARAPHRAGHGRGLDRQLRRAGRLARRVRLHAGPVPDAAQDHRWPGPAPLVLDLRRRRRRRAARRRAQGQGRHVLELDQRAPGRRRQHQRDGAAGPLLRADRAAVAAPPRGHCRRQRHHADPVDHEDGAGPRADAAASR